MKRILLPIALLPLAACVVHFHIHEAPRPEREVAPAAEAKAAPAAPSTKDSSGDRVVSGTVVDDTGQPIRARVAAVGAGGSLANGTDASGRFELKGVYWPEFTLHASTDDDLLAIATAVPAGAKGVKLVVRPAAAVSVRLTDEKSSRCAFYQGGARIEDFTLRPGKPSRVVVPEGDVHVRLYDGDVIRAERDVHVSIGEHKEIELGG
jgi:hypothetical protein